MTIQTSIEADPGAVAAPTWDEKNSHHWTAAGQRIFLEKLAESGSVQLAAAEAGKSRRAAYNLRFRTAGKAFKLGWEAALLVARATLADELMERSVNGQISTVIRDDLDRVAGRQHRDNRLAMSMLSRLDRQCDTPVAGSEHALAGIIAQDFEAFLDLVSAGGAGSEAALFVQARTPAEPGQETAETCAHGRCELCGQEEAGEAEEEPHELGLAPSHPAYRFAKDCSVWWDDASNEYRTDFPPPDGFHGWEEGQYGDDDYQRALSAEEEAAVTATHRAEIADRLPIEAQARDRWFGFAAAGEDAVATHDGTPPGSAR